MTANARPINKAVRKGLAHFDAGRIDSAERLFRSVLKSEPGNAEANHALGTLVVRQAKPDRGAEGGFAAKPALAFFRGNCC
jgi:hypothetical protein